jgi:hypothetical protein
MREPVRGQYLIAVNVRFPADLHKRLTQLATKEYRSLNRQVIVLIQEALDAREGQEKKQIDEEGSE